LVETGKPISDENDAFFEFGKKALTDSIDVIKDFIKLMIPLTTGLITTYFALLKFIGIESTQQLTHTTIFLSSPITLLISLLFFVVASFPVPMKLTISNIESIKRYRTVSMWWKYVGASVGGGLFLVGFGIVILTLISGF
jgi:hypothetical protein